MSAPNPSTHEPEPIRQLELNGPANIITHCDSARARRVPVDSFYLKEQARLFIGYIRKLETGRTLAWHEHLAEDKQEEERRTYALQLAAKAKL